ncbi:MAG: hypothetical protein KGI98_17050 [Euryarchaeota archaeon]|nr:hypothetical protein [Euryarchaeota archaeon]
MIAFPPPPSEADLLLGVPRSNRPGSFRRDILLPTERMIYEHQPGFLGSHPFAVGWTGFWTAVFVGLGFLVPVASLFFYAIGAGFVLLLFAIPLYYAYFVWRATGYALTDQRAIARKGSNYLGMYWAQIGTVEVAPRSRVVFAPLPPPPGASLAASREHRRGRMVWKRVPGASEVAAFALATRAFYLARDRERELRQQVVVRATMNTLRCEYCGYGMRVEEILDRPPRCPRCHGPVLVAAVRAN